MNHTFTRRFTGTALPRVPCALASGSGGGGADVDGDADWHSERRARRRAVRRCRARRVTGAHGRRGASGDDRRTRLSGGSGPAARFVHVDRRAPAQVQGHHEEGITIGAGTTIDRPVILALASFANAVTVEATPGVARDSGLSTRFRDNYLASMPSRQNSMFDTIKSAPGVSPTSPSSGTVNTVSVFGQGVNENQFLIDGTNFTCPVRASRAPSRARRHPGSPGADDRRLRRVRQHPGRGLQRRDEAGRRPLRVRRLVLRSSFPA